VAWNGTRWVAGGGSGGGSGLVYSDDGKSWTAANQTTTTLFGVSGECTGLAWNGQYWLASGGSQISLPTPNRVLAYSINGRDWTSVNDGSQNIFDISNNMRYAATVAARNPLPHLGGRNSPSTLYNYVEATTSYSIVGTGAFQNEGLTLQIPCAGVWLINGSIEITALTDGIDTSGVILNGTGLNFSTSNVTFRNKGKAYINNAEVNSKSVRAVFGCLKITAQTTVNLELMVQTGKTVLVEQRYLSVTKV
jgi:hypothetical protein